MSVSVRTRRRLLVAGSVVAVLACDATGVLLANCPDDPWCPPLVECLSPHGTFFVRNELTEPVTIRFDRPEGQVDLEVRAGETHAFDFACEATEIAARRTNGGQEIATVPGGICINKTWTIGADGGVTLRDGLPPEN
jgi:hypothetical protein